MPVQLPAQCELPVFSGPPVQALLSSAASHGPILSCRVQAPAVRREPLCCVPAAAQRHVELGGGHAVKHQPLPGIVQRWVPHSQSEHRPSAAPLGVWLRPSHHSLCAVRPAALPALPHARVSAWIFHVGCWERDLLAVPYPLRLSAGDVSFGMHLHPVPCTCCGGSGARAPGRCGPGSKQGHGIGGWEVPDSLPSQHHAAQGCVCRLQHPERAIGTILLRHLERVQWQPLVARRAGACCMPRLSGPPTCYAGVGLAMLLRSSGAMLLRSSGAMLG